MTDRPVTEDDLTADEIRMLEHIRAMAPHERTAFIRMGLRLVNNVSMETAKAKFYADLATFAEHA